MQINWYKKLDNSFNFVKKFKIDNEPFIVLYSEKFNRKIVACEVFFEFRIDGIYMHDLALI